MKKLLILLLTTTVFVLTPNFKAEEVFYDFNVSETTETVHDGSTSTILLGEMNMNGDINKQLIHFLDFELGDDVHLVAVDTYPSFGYSSNTLQGMILRYESNNPGMEVLAGINGDFFDIRDTQKSTSVHINNYEVLRGIENDRLIFNMREDGSADFSKAKVDGYEILVEDENREIKIRQKVDYINNANLEDGKIGVYLSSYLGEIPSDAVLVNAEDIKLDGESLQFAKGIPSLTSSVEELSDKSFIVAGSEITKDLTEKDTVKVQVKLRGYEDVRGAVGGTEFYMVEEGVPNNSINPDKHPRTAVGIREDGSVFFMVAHGRDTINDIPGVTFEEIGHIMLEHGAYNAINLDGGGSSTMMVREKDGTFSVVNQPTDGYLRSVSNGVLLVRGDINPRPVEVLGEDTRQQFSVPENIYVNSHNEVRFEPVIGAKRYIVEVGGVEYQTSSTKLNIGQLLPRDYEIRVKVMGTSERSASNFSNSINYQVKRLPAWEMVEYLRSYAQNIN